MPRAVIDWLVILAFVAALNVAAARGMMALAATGPRPHPIAGFGWGALLMADILVIAIPVGLASRRLRPFLWGFEVFGVAALACYLAMTLWFAEELLLPLAEMILRPLAGLLLRNGMTTLGQNLLLAAVAVVTAAPQVALAVFGGCVSHLFRVGARVDGDRA